MLITNKDNTHQVECIVCKISDYKRKDKEVAVKEWKKQGWLIKNEKSACPECQDLIKE